MMRCLTQDGRSFDGAGIPPDLPTPVFTDAEFSHDRDSALALALHVLSGAHP
ncbi:hypothetical protein ACIGXM_20260 [Kitasatospora sp. NPDC052896]|uniref:hypothetical protein n=1 Tax=Kitasatospora sp. NPDC052896 TaxID=3364061 RepID=UPI0037CA939E